jgi:hypothetical protein
MQRFLEKYRLAGEGRTPLSPFKARSRQAYRRAMWSAMMTVRKIRQKDPTNRELAAIWLGKALAFRILARQAPCQSKIEPDRVILGGVSGEPLTMSQLGVGKYNNGGL